MPLAFSSLLRKIEERVRSIGYSINSFDRENSKLEDVVRQINKQIADIERIKSESKNGMPWLANAIAEYYYLRDEDLALYLETKKRSAQRSADIVKAIACEKRDAIRELKETKYKLAYYESLYPELNTLLTEDASEDVEVMSEDEKQDEVLRYISKKEYCELTPSQRNQKALDVYKTRNHSKSHIGKMYERYIGYLYETNGYEVEYFGIKEKLNDLGRDLICIKNNRIAHVVQCKNWSQRKEIHENAICQLYGTTAKFKIEHRKKTNSLFSDNVMPVFFTTTRLSYTACEFAVELGVKCSLTPMSMDYPMIKCNLGSYDEKIYHLPFDQQYDRTKINKKGEFYAHTVSEAEKAGFRRAKRWIDDTSNSAGE